MRPFRSPSSRALRLGWGLLLCMAAMPLAAIERFALDPVHTRVALAIDHAGYSQALGTVSGSHGVLAFAPGDWAGARLEARIPLDRIDFGDARWNEAVRARRLLDTERHPEAVFVSERVEAGEDDRFIVHGHLTLRGVTRPVALEVRFNALKRYPLPPFRRTAGFSATATLSRSDFGIDAWGSLIGDAVELRIEAEATASRRARFSDEAPAAPDIVDDDEAPTEEPGTDADTDADAGADTAAETGLDAAAGDDIEPAARPEDDRLPSDPLAPRPPPVPPLHEEDRP